MNGLEVSKQTFDEATTETKLSLLYDIAVASYQGTTLLKEDVSVLKKRKRFDTAVSSVSGMIGGMIAVVGSKLLWKP